MVSTKFLAGAAALSIFAAPALAQAPELEAQQQQQTTTPAQTQAPAGNPATAAPAAGAAAGATAAAASGTLDFAAGGTVYDAQGNEVGKIEGVAGEAVTVNTGTNKVGVPKGSFAAGPKGPAIAMTKAELDAAAAGAKQESAATVAASVTVGAKVADQSGGDVGTIKSVTGDVATIKTANAEVGVPTNAFAKGPNGLVIGMTAAQLEAASKSAASSGGN